MERKSIRTKKKKKMIYKKQQLNVRTRKSLYTLKHMFIHHLIPPSSTFLYKQKRENKTTSNIPSVLCEDEWFVQDHYLKNIDQGENIA